MLAYLTWLTLGLLLYFTQVYGQNCKEDGCPDNLCCSKHGYCGNTPEHCEGSTPKTNITLQMGDCRICGCSASDDCCSPYGFCGKTKEHCDKITIILPESALISQTRINDCRICQNCQIEQICCSNTGYCVDKAEECDANSAMKNSCQPNSLKFYKIFNPRTKKFLDCDHFSTNPNSSTVTQWSKSNTLNQLWQFVPVNETARIYAILSIDTMKALTITSSDYLQQWAFSAEKLNQQFQIGEENSLCTFMNLQTNRSMTVKEIRNGAPVRMVHSQTNLWKLIETDITPESVQNYRWRVLIGGELGEICNDDEETKSEKKLTLNDCLNWCNIDQRKKFCMWNFEDMVVEIGYCIAVNRCEKRSMMANGKYRIYIHQPKMDNMIPLDLEEDETLSTPTTSLMNYIDYSKYLLLQANDFDFSVEPLRCTDLDPQNQAVLTFNSSDEGIRFCDLCPNLPPFDKYSDYFIHSIPLTQTANTKFDECFLLCVEDIRCIGYSYNQQNFTCFTFNQTSIKGTNGLVYRPNWITVLIKQPIGVIQNWLYSRHTKIMVQFDEDSNEQTEQAESFLQCLNICVQSQRTCLAISYDFKEKLCHLFENMTTNQWVHSAYGSISAFHFSHIYAGQSNQWKFIAQDEKKVIEIDKTGIPSDMSQTCTLSNETSPSEYEIYYNPNCLISNANGCDLQTGCQLCLKFKANFEQNLPLCPSSLTSLQQDEQMNIQLEDCMNICIEQSTTCLAFDYDPLTPTCTYIRTYSNWSNNQKENSKRYLLSYPPKPYQFIPDCQITSSSVSKFATLDECLKTCQSSCEKVSYNYQTSECRIGSYTTGVQRIQSSINSHCFIRNFFRNNDLTSIRLAFYRHIAYRLDLSFVKVLSFQCSNDCSIQLDQCLITCLNLSECQYVSVTYQRTNSFSCRLFSNKIDETKDFLADQYSEIYYRYFDINLTEDKMNHMTLFQVETDLAECYDQTRTGNKYRQTYSTLKGYRDVLENDVLETGNDTVKLRQRRFFKKAFNWLKDKVVKPIVDTVVDVMKTPIQIGKAIGALVSGDTEKAKQQVLDIGIVKDIKSIGENVIEFGKALGKGDLKGAGKSLLNVGADAIGFVPIPGGRVLGKIGSNGIKNGLKGTKTNSKPNFKKKKDNDNKKSDNDRRKQCARRTKRKAKHDRCDSDDDDDDNDKDRHGPKCRRPSPNNNLQARDCHMKSVGTRCKWSCDIGYVEPSDEGSVCRRQNNKNSFWRPEPKCQPQSCGAGKYSLISVETDGIVAYTVYFDTDRRLPVWSFSIHDSKNRVTPLTKVRRAKDFYQHPCPQLKNNQPTKAQYTRSGWDRGHLSPSDAHRYSIRASKSSNFLINVAPQDPWTNQVAWKIIEAHILCHNNKYPASLVVTGVCPDSHERTKSIKGLQVPSCFWKMICYVRNGRTHVIGFLAENKKINRLNRKSINEAKMKIFKPVSQATIRDRLKFNVDYSRSPFDQPIYQQMKKGRMPTIVQPFACTKQMLLDETEADVWYKDFTAIKKSQKKSKRALPGFNARGCSPEEAQAMALFLGLNSLDIDDDDGNMSTMQNDDDNDLSDEDDDDNDDDDDGGMGNRPEASKCGKRIIGYYPSWGTGKISGKHIRRLTHIIYAFFEVDNSGTVFLGSADRTHSQDVQKDIEIAKKRLQHLLNLKKKYSEQKYLFAVGGWENSQYFSSIAQSPEKRLRFIGSSLKLLDEYGLDGIDIDWEHPVTGGAVEGIPEDKQNYVLFMKEIRQALDQHGGKGRYLLSLASAAGQWTLDPGYDLPGLLKYADFINIMTYDFFGAWESKWGAYTGPPAPLYFGMPPRFSGKTNVDWTVKYYVCRTGEPHKINVGVPFYGRYWKNVPRESIDPEDGMWRKANAVNGKFEGGFASWNEIKTSWLTNPAYKQENHAKTKSSYAYNAQEGIFLGFESPQSLKDKVNYASEKNVGGLMIWAIDQDDDDLTMMNIVSSASLCKNTDPKATFYKCSPLKGEKRWWTMEDSEEKAGMCGRSAPLYKGYYPVCDSDDPGYSCCSPQGYCGFSDKHCKGQGVNYGENPDLLVEEPVRPTINPILWYLLDAPDGRRGRCGRDAPKLDDGNYAICNPDDKNSHCCSNGGYCGTGKEFCDCEECIDFRKQPNYRFKPKRWHDNGKCGDKAPKIDNQIAICNPDSKTAYCCSASGYCGSGTKFCDCKGCINHKNN